MKRFARLLVATVLGRQVRRLRKKSNFKVVAVVGSIGKTSTKLAIASVLSAGLRVRFQDGNYNDLVSVPLVFFGQELPSLYNPFAWLAVFWRNSRQVRRDYPYDVVVVELGSDSPGQIAGFKRYIKADLTVITAVTPEHMQSFDGLDAVAAEELAAADFSAQLLANLDLCPAKYLAGVNDLQTYGLTESADFVMGTDGRAEARPENLTIAELPLNLSRPEQYSRLAAAVVAHKLGLKFDVVAEGLQTVKAPPGRMQRLAGINNSLIIDDSYNASPEAVKIALATLYKEKAAQKIAILGNMNELGAHSVAEHTAIGQLCDPGQLAAVITIGSDANQYLAAAAEAKGCQVKRFDNPYQAGEYAKTLLKPGAVVLVKGSQNRVFAEEAIKPLLADPSNAVNLVRQSPQWLEIKKKAFAK